MSPRRARSARPHPRGGLFLWCWRIMLAVCARDPLGSKESDTNTGARDMQRTYLQVSVTWQTVTPESAEDSDIDSHGYRIDHHDFELDQCDVDVHTAMTAHEAARTIIDQGCAHHVNVFGNDAATFYADEPQSTDYSDGSQTTYTVHVKGPKRLLRALVKHVKPTYTFG